jgi:hypothetical protein
VTIALLLKRSAPRITATALFRQRPPTWLFALYLFTHPNMRKALEIPCIRVGKLVRFKLEEVTAWAKRTHAEMTGFGVQDTSDPIENRKTLLHAIGNLIA